MCGRVYQDSGLEKIRKIAEKLLERLGHFKVPILHLKL